MNNLTKKQDEILTILGEECAEVIQICSKIKRWGLEDHHPDDKKKTPNAKRLEEELGDVLAMLHFVIYSSMGVTEKGLLAAYKAKLEKLKVFSEHLYDES